jgi:hypothetical protein
MARMQAVRAARSVSPLTGRSVLYGRKTTALTWKLERSAWNVTRFLARFWDPGYYRTYGEDKGEPAGYWSVEQEVRRALASAGDDRAAWVVRDGNYLSARWPGDVHAFARRFAQLLAA